MNARYQLSRPTIEESIKLEFQANDDDLWVYCDVAQLENALLNLVLNSRDAMIRSGKGDTITLKARCVAEIEVFKMMRDIDGSLGYNVETASNGYDAILMISEGQPIDLFVTDVVMLGGLCGFVLARSARQVKPGLPVIYMSGYTGFSHEDMGEVIAS